MQILMLPRRRLAAVHGARGHVVDELVMLLGKSLLLPLTVKRNLAPFERAVGVAEGAGAMLLAFRRFHPFGVADGAGVLDLAADLLFISVAQAAAVLDMIGKVEKSAAVFL